MNPYGFRCGRRFNEDNVDLNRNLLDEADFAELREQKASRRLGLALALALALALGLALALTLTFTLTFTLTLTLALTP